MQKTKNILQYLVEIGKETLMAKEALKAYTDYLTRNKIALNRLSQLKENNASQALLELLTENFLDIKSNNQVIAQSYGRLIQELNKTLTLINDKNDK